MGSEQKPHGPPATDDLHPLLLPPAASVAPIPSVIPDVHPQMDELERRCAAFVRRDSYGTMGRGPFPLLEKLRLSVALLTVLPLRLAVASLIVFCYYLICRLCTLFSSPDRLAGWRRSVVLSSGRFLSRAVLFVMGFHWISVSRHEGLCATNTEESERPGVIISNHVSYVDVLYHMSSSSPSFVAKRSVAGLPLVGIISKCLCCVYVQRESKSSDSKGVAGVIMDRVHKGHKNEISQIIMIFPEGTTSNGDFLLPFKTGAFLAKAPALPVILKYPYKRFSPAWDSISGLRHLVLLLCQFQNHLEAVHLPIYYPSQQEKDDPKLYANNVRKLMATEGNLSLSDVGLAEKRTYHATLNGNGLPKDLHQKDD